MFYEGFVSGDRIKVIPTYRSLMPPFLRSDIRDYNNPGANYKPKDPIFGTVISETLTGIWVMAEMPVYENFVKTNRITLKREFYEKEEYIFEDDSPKVNKMMTFLNS